MVPASGPLSVRKKAREGGVKHREWDVLTQITLREGGVANGRAGPIPLPSAEISVPVSQEAPSFATAFVPYLASLSEEGGGVTLEVVVLGGAH